MLDRYKNMPIKVLEFYKWVYDKYRNNNEPIYVMKMDDDVYLNLVTFASTILYLPTNLTRLGFFWYDVKKEDSSSKYYDSIFKAGTVYPPYAAGPAHSISWDLLEHIVSIKNPLIIQNDDVNVDLWLYPVDFQRLHDDRFHGGFALCCGVPRRDDFFTIVNIEAEDMREIHKFVSGEENWSKWDRKLSYYDCNCYLTKRVFPSFLVSSMWIFYLFAGGRYLFMKFRFTVSKLLQQWKINL